MVIRCLPPAFITAICCWWIAAAIHQQQIAVMNAGGKHRITTHPQQKGAERMGNQLGIEINTSLEIVISWAGKASLNDGHAISTDVPILSGFHVGVGWCGQKLTAIVQEGFNRLQRCQFLGMGSGLVLDLHLQSRHALLELHQPLREGGEGFSQTLGITGDPKGERFHKRPVRHGRMTTQPIAGLKGKTGNPSGQTRANR